MEYGNPGEADVVETDSSQERILISNRTSVVIVIPVNATSVVQHGDIQAKREEVSTVLEAGASERVASALLNGQVATSARRRLQVTWQLVAPLHAVVVATTANELLVGISGLEEAGQRQAELAVRDANDRLVHHAAIT